MKFVERFIKSGIVILLFLISFMAYSQPPFTPPGQGQRPPAGNPPGPPCGVPGRPCPPIPLSEGIGFLIAAGALIGVKKIYARTKAEN